MVHLRAVVAKRVSGWEEWVLLQTATIDCSLSQYVVWGVLHEISTDSDKYTQGNGEGHENKDTPSSGKSLLHSLDETMVG